MNRIVSIQSSIQLLASLAVIEHLKRTEPTQSFNDHLVIHSLFAPEEAESGSVDALTQMARVAGEFESVVFLDRNTVDDLSANSGRTAPRVARDIIRQKLNLSECDRILTNCQSWQMGNRILAFGYPDAHRICYGDTIGLFASRDYFGTRAVADRRSIRETLGRVAYRLRQLAGRAVNFSEQPYHQGCFALRDVFEKSPFPSEVIPRDQNCDVYRQKLRQLLTIYPEERLDKLRRSVAGRNVSVLLTSNYAETNRTDSDAEIDGYLELLKREAEQDDLILVKPHPKESRGKIDTLIQRLDDAALDSVVLTDPFDFTLPFEVLFEALFCDVPEISNNVRVVAVSPACLSLEYIFGCKTIVGFGEELAAKVFHADYLPQRLRQEGDVRNVQQLLQA